MDDALEREKSTLRAKLERHLEGKPFRFNPDAGVVDRLLAAMAMRQRKTGSPYCPCRVATGDPEKDKDIACPCVYHEAEVERQGFCHCRLFVK